MLRTISHNVRSLRQPEATELIIASMQANHVEAYCMQETWLGGSEVKTNKGFTIILVNDLDAKRRGVGIILSKAATEAWDAAGRRQCSPSTRVLAIRLEYADAKGKTVGVCLISAYRPTSSAQQSELDAFDDALSEACGFAHADDIVAVHMDGNGSIGVSNHEDRDRTVGPYGIAHQNASGKALLDLMRSLGMFSATSFFDAGARLRRRRRRRASDRRKLGKAGGRRCRQRRWRRQQQARERIACHGAAAGKGTRDARAQRAARVQGWYKRQTEACFATWAHPRSGNLHQLDHIWISGKDRRALRAAHVRQLHVGSDHFMVAARIAIARRLRSGAKPPPKVRVDRHKLRDQDTCKAFAKAADEHLNKAKAQGPLRFQQVDNALCLAAEETLATKERRQRGWFREAKDQILGACSERNAAFRQVVRTPSAEARAALRAARARVRRVVRKARSEWLERAIARVETVKPGGQPLSPADAWDAMKELARGMDETVRPTEVPVARAGNAGLSRTARERLSALAEHFKAVFNRTSTYDPTVLQELPQREVLDSAGSTPTQAEIEEMFLKAKNGKACGLSGSCAEFYKAALEHSCSFASDVCDLVAHIWRTGSIPDYWHQSRLKEVPKAGKDLSKPGNYRGIALLEVALKILSAIVNKRLQSLLVAVGRESQNGFTANRGTVDSSFCLRSTLQILREHGLESWVAFIDLVKAFDSVDREALCSVLARYGAPPPLVNVVRAMHAKVIVRMVDGVDEVEFASGIGVLQGAAASPVLFLFMISAWFETCNWPEDAIVLRTESDPTAPGARHSDAKRRLNTLLIGKGVRDKGKSFRVLDFLYADDAAIISLRRAGLAATITALVAHGKRWGLEVHTATSRGGSSKTEFIVVPPHRCHANFQPDRDLSPLQVGEGKWITRAVTKINGTRHEGVFKYLGSYVAEDLSEDFDIEQRISSASRAFGRFSKVIFRNKALSMAAKARAFTAFVLSILLYQCECWALRVDQEQKLTVFFNRCVRAMAGVSRKRQHVQHITSAELAERMGLRTFRSYLEERVLKFAGHVARMRPKRLARRLMFAWHPATRARGRPRQTFRHRLHSLLRRATDCVALATRRRILRDGWAGVAQDRAVWRRDVVEIHCCIPPKCKDKRDWLAEDVAAHGEWRQLPVAAGNQTPTVFTDGSCLGNGTGEAAAGAGVFHAAGDGRNISQPLLPHEPQTNNRGELTAILLALAQAEPLIAQGQEEFVIGTDSQYSMHMFGAAGRKTRARGWKSSRNRPCANADLVALALAWRDQYGHLFRFVHIYAHTGKADMLSVGNAGADDAAVAGAKKAGSSVVIILVRGPWTRGGLCFPRTPPGPAAGTPAASEATNL